jgi:purine catabolism regulator
VRNTIGMVESTPFTLRDLVDTPELGLELIVGGADAGSRAVVGAQSSEIEHPTRWLDREWVLLIAGVGLSGNAAAERALIAELDEQGITALGFALDVVHAEVPAALVEEARERRFPIFTVPLRTGFRDVIGTVYRNVMSQEIRAAHRLTAMQRFLMDAIGEESPDATVVERLRSLLGAKVGVLHAGGRLAPSTFDAPGEELLAAITTRPQSPASFELGDLHGLAFPIDLPGPAERRWLVIASTIARPLHPLARSAAHAALPLFIAMARLSRVQVEHDMELRRAALEALLHAEDRDAAALAAARARACGVDVAGGVAGIAVVATAPPQAEPGLLRAIERGFADPPPMLVVSRDDGERLIGLMPAPVTDRALTDYILACAPGVRIGVGRTVSDAVAVKQSILDAELAAREPRPRSVSAIVRYDDLDVGTILLNEVSMGRLTPKIEEWIGPLQANPMLYETVLSFLNHNLDVSRTARALRLHPNSVRYRLTRAEELIRAPLRAPATIVGLHVAMAMQLDRDGP